MVLDDAWNRTTQESGHAGVLPVHIAALILAVINFLLNGLICVAFHNNRKLLTRCHLYIFYAFAITNCLSGTLEQQMVLTFLHGFYAKHMNFFFNFMLLEGFFTIPTLVNLFVHNNLNCPRWTIIVGSGFEIGLDRMRKVLAIMIALERLFAVYWPSQYYVADHFGFVKDACTIGILWGSIDSMAMILEEDLATIRMHCVTTSSSGYVFHTYFLISSFVFDIVLVIVYALFIVKLCMVSESLAATQGRMNANAMSKNYRQIVFMEAGPVVTIGYHMYGCTSFFLYSWRHRDIRAAIM
uniref:G protein-coupled receptor n=1 Tax=Ascaris lumbricoides TaxID=6252 RepID=A0A0M3HQ54_ASCLU